MPARSLRAREDGVLAAEVPEALAGTRADVALARMFPEHSRSRIQAWGRAGRITFDGLPANLAKKVWGGERVRIEADASPQETSHRAEAIGLRIVFEDEALIVIDKPSGLVVHPASGNWHGTLLNALLHHVPALAELPRAGIVHRLDKDTSGLLVVAKTATAQTSLVRQLQARTVTRRYTALVHGHVARDGSVAAPIGRDPRARTRMAVIASGKPARTHYRVQKRFAQPVPLSLLECALDTGRTHQIRVHLRSIGHPLVGDPTYGMRRADLPAPLASFARQALHARALVLAHPSTGAPMHWEAPLPRDLRELIEALA
jgi:23S rRNA pseudouridine1911/1915/1917 synthase